ncbi:MAG: response regulator [Synergistaceae bacterium]|nr:response regulator [Synergistaceae bacterium]
MTKRIPAPDLTLMVFLSSALLVVFLALYTRALVDFAMTAMEDNIRKRMLFVSGNAARLVSAEELDRFRVSSDMKLPEYEALRRKLAAFADDAGVLYVYYVRTEGDKYQFIIDNDFNEETSVGLNTEPIAREESPELADVVRDGVPRCTEIGNYTEGWDGLLTAYSPIFDDAGRVVAAAGADIEDTVIFNVRYRTAVISRIHVLVTAIIAIGGFFSFLRYRRKAALAQENNRAKSRFLARMSHEIRSPMNAIIGMSELAAREYGHPECRGYIAEIRRAGTNLLSIINDILDFSKIEADSLQIASAPYEMSQVLNDVLNIIQIRLAEKPIELITDFDADIPAAMTGDEARIRQILLNLLSNAVKYTKEGFIKFSALSLRMSTDTVKLTFIVEDSGIGIKEEDLPKLFGEFVRLGADHMSIEGTGLGLAIARSLCRQMGGDISVSSVYGKGSLFTAVINQRRIDGRTLGVLGKNGCPALYTNGVKFTAPGVRILVVDDIETNLAVAAGLMSPYKFQIDTCLGGNEAILLARENRFDFILMDHMMPEMDGMEATAAIRATPGEYFKTVPIIALTANAVSGMREMFLENGFNDFLSKPIEIPKLNELLDRWVPEEKRVWLTEAACTEARPSTGLKIDGVDAERGIAMTGGTWEGYAKVLGLYCEDAAERLVCLREFEGKIDDSPPDDSALALFITQVHALKSASASIGAAELSRVAAALEDAAARGDMTVISEKLEGFREALSGLLDRVRRALPSEGAAPPDGEAVADRSALRRLKEALEAWDVGAADSILGELREMPSDQKTRDVLSGIADRLLLSDFKTAADMTGKFLEFLERTGR